MRVIAGVLFSAVILTAQPGHSSALCPRVVGIYPVDLRFDVSLHLRARFEVRACGKLDDIQLVGFEADAREPSLIEGGSHIELLIQTGTVIVIQMTAGSSSPTLVAQFQKGKPMLLAREDGIGGVTYSEDGEYAVVTIPQKTFPNADGKFAEAPPHRYRLKRLD